MSEFMKFDDDKAMWHIMPIEPIEALFETHREAISSGSIADIPIYSIDLNPSDIIGSITDSIYDWRFTKNKRNMSDAFSLMFFYLRGKPYIESEALSGARMVSAFDLEEIANVYTHGAKKYAIDNWRTGEEGRYYSALMRHFKWVGTKSEYDADSGFKHIYHAIWNAFALYWLSLQGENK